MSVAGRMNETAAGGGSAYWLKVYRRGLPPPPLKIRVGHEPPSTTVEEWAEAFRPDDVAERDLVRRAAHLSSSLERARRAEDAIVLRLARRAEAKRSERAEVLGRRLLGELPPPKPRAGRDSAADALPIVLLRRLESEPAGCRWLIDRWAELATLLGTHAPVGDAEVLRLMRLLGKGPLEAGYDEQIGAILAACEAFRPGKGRRLFESCRDLIPADDPALRGRRTWVPPAREDSGEPKDGSEVLGAALLEVIAGETARLTDLLNQHLADVPAQAPATTCKALERLQRVQMVQSRELRQVVEQLRKFRRDAAKQVDPEAVPAAAPETVASAVGVSKSGPLEPPSPRQLPPRSEGEGAALSNATSSPSEQRVEGGNEAGQQRGQRASAARPSLRFAAVAGPHTPLPRSASAGVARPGRVQAPVRRQRPPSQSVARRTHAARGTAGLDCRSRRGGVSSGDRPLAEVARGTSS